MPEALGRNNGADYGLTARVLMLADGVLQPTVPQGSPFAIADGSSSLPVIGISMITLAIILAIAEVYCDHSRKFDQINHVKMLILDGDRAIIGVTPSAPSGRTIGLLTMRPSPKMAS